MNRSCMVPCAIPYPHSLLTCTVLPGSEARRLRVARKCVPEKKKVPFPCVPGLLVGSSVAV